MTTDPMSGAKGTVSRGEERWQAGRHAIWNGRARLAWYGWKWCVVFCAWVAAGCAAVPMQSGAAAAVQPGQSMATAKAVPERWTGVVMPITGGCIPKEQDLLPGASRSYRGGIHQGLDFYRKDDGRRISCGEPVLNAMTGKVVRADKSWDLMSREEYDTVIDALKKGQDESLLDRLRGRQVWVKAPDGMVLRYCHLAGLSAGITEGIEVRAGIVLGAVGNTGTEGGTRGTSANCHLHFEVWPTPGGYLGQGMTPEQAGRAFEKFLGSAGPDTRGL